MDEEKKTALSRASKSKKSRRKRRKSAASNFVEKQYKLLCFDSETTHHGELLELSVFDIDGNEVYHQYFRPKAKSWPTEIHHISPAMVADRKRFSAHRKEIERLLNSTEYFVGCALSNDIHSLRRHGVKLHGRQIVFDIQNWHWLLNDDTKRREKQQTGLSGIAKHYGLGFGEECAHSATADTRLTLRCFTALVNDFSHSDYGPGASLEDLKGLHGLFCEAYSRANQEFKRANSGGFLNVMKREQGYSFRGSRFAQSNNERIVLSVEVADRGKAEKDLREFFEPKQLKGLTGIFDLDEKDFELISNYKNKLEKDNFGVNCVAPEEPKKQTVRERARKSLSQRKVVWTPVKSNANTKKASAKRAATKAMRSVKSDKSS